LVVNPVPQAEEISQSEMAPFIQTALADAERQGIVGKAVTPFLLQRIFDLTDGRSLTANIALVRNNARLAAEIAQEINTLT
jgi:pseudouridine-5'-phosphate glycosidase